MIYLFVGYSVVLLISLLFGSWKGAFLALAIESLISGFILLENEGFETWSTRIQLIDLILVRGVIIPIYLIGLLKKLKTPRNFDVVPANFIIWAFAIVLVVFPFDTAVSAVLIGFFILANQKEIQGQMIGFLTLEAGIILAECLTPHHERWEIQLGLSLVFIWTMSLFSRFLTLFSKPETERIEGEVL